MSSYGTGLFAGTADYFSKYRPIYPSFLLRFLIDRFTLNGKGKLLDLGCGTGQFTLRFSDWCEEIVGLDIEHEMIEEAQRLHREVRIGTIHWYHGTLEQYKLAHDNRFNLVTIAKAFHWMDRTQILEELYDVVEPGGGVAVIDNYEPDKKLEPWQIRLNEVVKKWYGDERRAGDTAYEHPSISHEEVLADSRFEVEVHRFPSYVINWNIESILGNLYSTSYGARRFIEGHIEAFEREVEEALLEVETGGIFKETMNLSVLIGVKKELFGLRIK
jgi:ubiquinone/menaquinone biosynthesis C-methylase UbiE